MKNLNLKNGETNYNRVETGSKLSIFGSTFLNNSTQLPSIQSVEKPPNPQFLGALHLNLNTNVPSLVTRSSTNSLSPIKVKEPVKIRKVRKSTSRKNSMRYEDPSPKRSTKGDHNHDQSSPDISPQTYKMTERESKKHFIEESGTI